MTRRIAVRAIVLHEGKLLCVRQKPYNPVSATMDGIWCTPGGGLDDGESLTDGVIREMLEETGVTPIVGPLLYVQQFSHHDSEFLEFFFAVLNGADYLNIDLSRTSHGGAEIEEIGFMDPAKTPLLPQFLTTETIADDFAGGKTKIFNYL